jgi:hypothetical protein
LKDGDIVVNTKSVKLYSGDLLDGKVVGVYRESISDRGYPVSIDFPCWGEVGFDLCESRTGN